MPGLRGYLIVPLEVGGDGEAHTEDGACNWLDAGLHDDGGDLVDALLHLQPNVHMVQHVTWEPGSKSLIRD